MCIVKRHDDTSYYFLLLISGSTLLGFRVKVNSVLQCSKNAVSSLIKDVIFLAPLR